jgi:peroxiredoxin family protein
MSINGERGSVAIILHSAAYDRASYALTLALVTLATGMEAHMLLTHGGLRRFSRGRLEEMGEETDLQTRKDMEIALMAGAVRSLERQLADAKELGLKLYACSGAMAILNLRRDDLVPEVDETIGLVTFLELARAALVNWYV